MLRRPLIVVALAALIAGCNGGSATPPPFNTGTLVTPSPTPSPTPNPATATGTLATSMTTSTSLSLGPIGPGDIGTTSCAPASAASNLVIVYSLSQPAGTPTVASVKRVPRTIGVAGITPFGYFTVTPSATVTCPNTPTYSMTFPAGTTLPNPANSYVAMYDPGNAATGWNAITGPATISGNTISWTTNGFPISLVAARTYAFVLFTAGAAPTLATPTPTPTPTPSPTPTPTPTPSPVPLHLYVGNDNAAGQILQFNLPLTSSTTSNFTITAPTGNVVALAVDANGDLLAGLLSGNLQFYTAPLSGASSPAATFPNGAASNNGQPAFLNTGDFWAATVSNRVNRFNAPFSNASAPAAFVTDPGMVSAIGVAIDPAQNLYIGNAGVGTALTCASGAGKCSNVYVYAPPYTGAPIVTPNNPGPFPPSTTTFYRKMAATATRLYAAAVSGTASDGAGRVDVYNLPITAASTPAFDLTSGINTPEGIAVDPAGNLYVGNLSDATVTVYTAPITASSTPSIIFKVSTGAFAIFGIAVGK